MIQQKFVSFVSLTNYEKSRWTVSWYQSYLFLYIFYFFPLEMEKNDLYEQKRKKSVKCCNA